MLPSSLKATLSNRTTFKPRAFATEWALQAATELDTCSPHFLLHLLHASDQKRQTLYLILAELQRGSISQIARKLPNHACTGWERLGDPLTRIARALVAGKPREIIRCVFKECPDGLLGTLARLGPEPLGDWALYRELYRLFADPWSERRAHLLRQTSGTICEAGLRIVLGLDPVLLHPHMFAALSTPEQMDQLHGALEIIRATVSAANDENLRASVKEMAPGAEVKTWVEHWLRRMDRPLAQPPVNDADLVPVYGAGLETLGRTMRNCAGQHLAGSATGQTCILWWTEPPGAVVKLSRLSDERWLVDEIKGASNRRPDPKLVAAICHKLHAAGVLTLASLARTSAVRGLSQLLCLYEPDDLFFEDPEQAETDCEQFA